jgi:hypothetical protein
MRNSILCAVLCILLMASCATQKSATGSTETISAGSSSTASFVEKVVGNAVTAENIVGNATVTVKLGSKNVTVPGALHMRKDKVIRLQLFVPILGTEIGRLEFTPSQVLVVNRLAKEYVRGDYNQLDFLRDNGISFYSLQALFWNQLAVPGKHSVTAADAGEYTVDLASDVSYVPLTLARGKMKYQWSASRKAGTLTSAVITYNSANSGTSMLSWLYSNFTTVSGKSFPRTQEFSFQTSVDGKPQEGTIKIDMSEVKTSSNWETETTLSSKYTQVDAENALSRIMKF